MWFGGLPPRCTRLTRGARPALCQVFRALTRKMTGMLQFNTTACVCNCSYHDVCNSSYTLVRSKIEGPPCQDDTGQFCGHTTPGAGAMGPLRPHASPPSRAGLCAPIATASPCLSLPDKSSLLLRGTAAVRSIVET